MDKGRLIFGNVIGKRTIILLASLSAIAIGRAIYRFYYNRNREITVKKLIVYPIKSLAGIEVDHLEVLNTGVKYGIFHDRTFVLLNENNNVVTQRTKPILSLIKSSFSDDQIWLDVSSMETLKIPYEFDSNSGSIIDFTIWSTNVQGVDCGDKIAEWFTKYLGSKTRLVKFTSDMTNRNAIVQSGDKIHEETKYPIIYQDGSPVLLINQASIDDLNSRLKKDDRVDYQNFRPNILIDSSVPYDEDSWKEIEIGDIHFENIKPCDRCTMPTVIISKGIKSDKQEPLKTLKKYRLSKEYKHLYKESPLFGINLYAHNQATISNGQKVLLK